ncbi:MAG TPA: SPOR domain-containing protein [Geobacteraceae bacterium]|nr:SPOR domain-containing protein [Geobacteraceae bacterium]
MKKEFIPEADDRQVTGGAKGSTRSILLLVLLLLVATFGYLYYFTGLIRPQGEAAKAPEAQVVQIKKPLPPRTEQGDEKTAPPAKPAEKQPLQAKAEKPVALPPQAKPAAAPAAGKSETVQQHVQAAVKPSAAPAAGRAETAQQHVQAAPKPPATPAQPAPVKVAKADAVPVHKEQPKNAPAAAQQVRPQPKESGKPVARAAAEVKKPAAPARGPIQAVKPAGRGAYTLLVGEFAADREAGNCRTRLKKLGIDPVHVQKVKKAENMHRLFMADFDTHCAADQEMQKLQKATDSTFILEEGGRFAVYAGSYLHQKGAAVEQKRLAGKGFKLIIKTAKVTIPMARLTAGSFDDSADAEKEAGRLRERGIIAKVVRNGK